MCPEADQRVNLRPYILIGCFVWGILSGFLFHLLDKSKPEDDKTPEKPVETVKVKPDIPEVDPSVKILTDAVDKKPLAGERIAEPPPEDGMVDPDLDKGTDSSPALTISADPPETPLLSLNMSWGLSSITAPAPSEPSPLHKPGPRPPERGKIEGDFTPGDGPELIF